MKRYHTHKFLMSSFAIVISTAFISKPTQASVENTIVPKTSLTSDSGQINDETSVADNMSLFVENSNSDNRLSHFVMPSTEFPTTINDNTTEEKPTDNTGENSDGTTGGIDNPDTGGGSETPGDGSDGGLENPDEPDKPDTGGSDGGSDNPDTGGGSETPGDGSDGGSDNPDKPDKPDTDGGSETPDGGSDGGSENPDKPDEPDKPDTGGGSETPDGGSGGGSGEPGKPDKPDKPDTGGGSETPDGGSGGGSGEPEKPDKPDKPDTGGGSETPGGGTGQPNQPNNGGTGNSKPSGSHNGTSSTPNPSDSNQSGTNNQHHSGQQPSSQQANDNSDNGNGTNSQGYTHSNNERPNNQEHPSNERQWLNRFDQMSAGSFKYNPFILNQIKQLSANSENVSDREISNVLRKQNFSDNRFLDELQKGTNYFKFQYFNPLKNRDYYKNLDRQVLALITGDIGSMPDLKKPVSKESSGKYEYHSSSDEEMTQTKDKSSSNAMDVKFERALFALIAAMLIIFIGVVIGYIVNRKKRKK
ncbi:SdrH family protein [Staphylococcus caeli]|uniref:SdrH family protein n=1 Tax=Staphylococcus caeli TaxID=2201815 RepID=UPI003F54499C